MDNAKAAGIKVVRTWGFRDLNATYVPGGLPQYGSEGAGASTIYYQSWADGKPTISRRKKHFFMLFTDAAVRLWREWSPTSRQSGAAGREEGAQIDPRFDQ